MADPHLLTSSTTMKNRSQIPALVALLPALACRPEPTTPKSPVDNTGAPAPAVSDADDSEPTANVGLEIPVGNYVVIAGGGGIFAEPNEEAWSLFVPQANSVSSSFFVAKVLSVDNGFVHVEIVDEDLEGLCTLVTRSTVLHGRRS